MKGKRIIALLLAAALIVLVGGCAQTPEEEEISGIEYDFEEFSLFLPEGWEKSELEGAAAYCFSEEARLAVYKESFAELAFLGITSQSPLWDYARLVKEANKIEDDAAQDKGDYYIFNYEADFQDADYYYMSVLKKGSDGFFMFTFVGFAEERSTLESQFLESAESIVMK